LDGKKGIWTIKPASFIPKHQWWSVEVRGGVIAPGGYLQGAALLSG